MAGVATIKIMEGHYTTVPYKTSNVQETTSLVTGGTSTSTSTAEVTPLIEPIYSTVIPKSIRGDHTSRTDTVTMATTTVPIVPTRPTSGDRPRSTYDLPKGIGSEKC